MVRSLVVRALVVMALVVRALVQLLVNSQLVCLPPVVIFKSVMFR